MKSTFDRDIIRKYYSNQLTEKEIEAFLQLMANPLHYPEITKIMKKQWDNIPFSDGAAGANGQDLLNKIHHRINLLQAEKRSGNWNLLILWRYFSKVAAILILPLLLFTIYDKFDKKSDTASQNYTISTPLSGRSNFQLPDGSTVWLNSGSKLTYPLAFNGNERAISLSGEAFFDVVEDHTHPFIVSAGKLNIKVLGTTFNIKSYDDEEHIEATLVKGKVRIENQGGENLATLEPKHRLVFSKNKGTYDIQKVDVQYYTSWKEGQLVFRDEPIQNVAKKLERWFNCTIKFEDDMVYKNRFTGSIEKETLLEVMELINITTPIDYDYDTKTSTIKIRSIKK